MAVHREQPPHARPTSAQLLERDWELNTIEQTLLSVRGGTGGVVCVQGPPGIGRSALLAAAAEVAQAAGVEVLAATATELERDFPLGVALQLLEPVWLQADPRDREALLLGAAGPAAGLLSGERLSPSAEAPSGHYRLIHAVHWVVRNLVTLEGSPNRVQALALVVDDLQWADGLSARLLAYLAQRLARLPIAVLAAITDGEASPAPQAIAGLRQTPRAVVLQPAPLTTAAVRELTLRRLPEAEDDVCAAVAAATAGNPYLVQALLDEALREELAPAADPGRVSALVPDAVVARARRQLDVLDEPTRAVAVGVALLGSGASVGAVDEFVAAERADVPASADRLAACGLLNRGTPLTYVQPLVRSAVLAGLPEAERARAHARTAHLLAARGAEPAEVAAHLVAGVPGADPLTLDLLRRCAATASSQGDGELAVLLLERALLERPPAEARVDILLDLHGAETALDRPQGADRLGEARRLTEDPRRLGRIALREAEALYGARDYPAAAALLDDALAGLNGHDPPLKLRLTEAYIRAAALVPELHQQTLDRRRRLDGENRERPTPTQRVALAHALVHECVRGCPADEIRLLGRRAWGDGALLDAVTRAHHTVPLLFISLLLVDELDLADELFAEVVQRESAAEPGLAALRPLRAWGLYLRGRLEEAQAEADASTPASLRAGSGARLAALSVTAACQLNRDEPDTAEAAIAGLAADAAGRPVATVLRLLLVAELELARHRPTEALAAAQAAGTVVARVFPDASPAPLRWRCSAAVAHVALGQPELALPLVDTELAAARKLGATGPLIRALRVKGLALGGVDGLALLREAVAVGDAATPRLEHVRALVDLGGALRRANQRSAARQPLTRGLDLANRGGATLLAARAHTELKASGARPRRLAFTGIESLTVSQRRVAELAAQGLTTRRIAETLFVSPKTVEFHLRQAYQKLDVRSRAELAERLGA